MIRTRLRSPWDGRAALRRPYLTSVLAKIAQTKLTELEQLLPNLWNAEDVIGPAPG